MSGIEISSSQGLKKPPKISPQEEQLQGIFSLKFDLHVEKCHIMVA